MTIRRRHVIPFVLVLGGLAYSLVSIPGCDRLITEKYIDTIVGHPSADFVVDTSFGCPPLTVSFTDSTVGEHDSWTWYFGDGDSSYEANPVHVYTAPGVYTVTLKVDNSFTGGTDTEVKNHLIKSGTSVTNIVLADTTGCAGFEASVRPGTYGGVDSFIWDFGDGSAPVVRLDDSAVSYTYDTSGSYTITLTAAGPCDTIVLTGAVPIVVGNCPIVGFEAGDSSGCTPFEVAFADLTTLAGQDSIVNWSWDFGDGGTSTDTNPIYTFTTAGEYTVSLTVTASDSSKATDSMTVPIAVYDSVTAGFTSLGAVTGCISMYQPFQVKFLNQSQGKVDSVRWYFGDGDSSTAMEPVHAYGAVGSYNVSLVAIGPCRTDSIAKVNFVKLADSLSSVAVTAEPHSTIDSAWTFTGISSDIVLEWYWEFPDGRTGSSQSYTLLLDSSASYPISLTIRNDCNEIKFDTTIDISLEP